MLIQTDGCLALRMTAEELYILRETTMDFDGEIEDERSICEFYAH
jgi:hypothetical protein